MAAWRTRFLTLAVVAAAGCTSQPSPSLLLPIGSAEDSAPDGDGALATGTAQATPQAAAAGEPNRQLPDTDELRAQREALVQGAIVPAVDDERIVEAFRTVPRHAFVPTDVVERAYGDFPLPIEAGQTISQPSLVAMMTELLEIESGERVLEVGTGSGAYLLSFVSRPDQHGPTAAPPIGLERGRSRTDGSRQYCIPPHTRPLVRHDNNSVANRDRTDGPSYGSTTSSGHGCSPRGSRD